MYMEKLIPSVNFFYLIASLVEHAMREFFLDAPSPQKQLVLNFRHHLDLLLLHNIITKKVNVQFEYDWCQSYPITWN